MSYSLNEIEAMAKRAARGAGLSWGLAEEAAKGTRWLASFGFDGPLLLTQLLEMNDCRAAVDFSPMTLEGVWRAPAGRMSPLIAGAALSDCAVRLHDLGRVEMQDLSYPLLSVPFLAGASLRLQVPLSAEWQGVTLSTDGRSLSIQGEDAAINVPHVREITFRAPATMPSRKAPVSRAQVDAETWARLGKFAHRTYAPSTEESRLRGAGAGVNDND